MLRECGTCYELVIIEPEDLTCPECSGYISGEPEERDDWFGLHEEEE